MVTEEPMPCGCGRTLSAALKRLSVPAPKRLPWGGRNGL